MATSGQQKWWKRFGVVVEKSKVNVGGTKPDKEPNERFFFELLDGFRFELTLFLGLHSLL